MVYLIWAYIIVVIVHYLQQIQNAISYHNNYEGNIKMIKKDIKVLALIPTYKEGKETLADTIRSVKASTNKFNEFIVVINNDLSDPRYIESLIKEFKGYDNLYFINGDKQGKREAQEFGFMYALEKGFYPDYVLTTDSDTIIDKNAVTSLVGQMLQNPFAGAVTGQVLAKKTMGWLNTIISLRYFLAFNQERAAQSEHGQVQCCSGPLTLYKGHLFHRVLKEYVSQTFGGIKATFGDDRHLTSLVLSKGFQTIFDSGAKAYTDTPGTFSKLIKQQLRWSKSYWRENYLGLFTTVKTPAGINWFSLWEILVSVFLPIALFFNILYIILFRSIHESIQVLWYYLLIVVIVAMFRSIFGLIYDDYNKKWEYIFLPIFAILNIFFFLPVRIWALLTLTKNKWGTR